MRFALRLVLFPLAALMLGGCMEDLADLVTLQRELIARFPDSEVNVNVRNRTRLEITLSNGAAVEADSAEQGALAWEIGRLAVERYRPAARLATISVAFGTSRSTGPVQVNAALHHFTFTPEELEQPVAPPAEEVTERVAAAS